MTNQPKKLHGCVKALLIFFYPFGLVYLCYWLTKRMASDLANYKKNSKPVKIAACILIFTGIIYPIGVFTGEVPLQTEDGTNLISGFIGAMAISFGGGFAMLRSCAKHKVTAQLYEKYAPCILAGEEDDLDSIAAIVGVEPQQLITDVQKLIDAGALGSVYIDRKKRKIVNPARQSATPKMDNRPRVSAVCPHCCGANRIIPGQKNICDYCDMPIEN